MRPLSRVEPIIIAGRHTYVVPRAVTIWDAAAPPQSQLFMLAGAAIIIPIILGYTAWAYWVFRGKVGAHGYH